MHYQLPGGAAGEELRSRDTIMGWDLDIRDVFGQVDREILMKLWVKW